MLIKKPTDIKPSEITDYADFKQRRYFIKQAALLGIGAGLGSLPLQSGASKTVTRGKAITPLLKTHYGKGLKQTDYDDITSYNNFYEFGRAESGAAEASRNVRTMRVSGWKS